MEPNDWLELQRDNISTVTLICYLYMNLYVSAVVIECLSCYTVFICGIIKALKHDWV